MQDATLRELDWDVIGMADIRRHELGYVGMPHSSLERMFEELVDMGRTATSADSEWLEQVHPGVRWLMGCLSCRTVVVFNGILDADRRPWVVVAGPHDGHVLRIVPDVSDLTGLTERILKRVRGSPNARPVNPHPDIQVAFREIVTYCFPQVYGLATWLGSEMEQ